MVKQIIFSLCSFFLFVSCSDKFCEKKNLSLDETYCLYKSTVEIVDRETEEIEYQFSSSILKKNEIQTLKTILDRKRFDYKITTDSLILISTKNVNTIESFHLLQSEMKTILCDTTKTWRWKN